MTTKRLQKRIVPIKNTAGNYLIGAWVRDSSAGIGTVTYYDTNENYFAGLGHGICDCDTYTLMPLASGEAVIAGNKQCDKKHKRLPRQS